MAVSDHLVDDVRLRRIQGHGGVANVLGRVENSIGERTVELIERHELSLAEYEVMVHLAEAPNRQLRMRDLAELCSLSPSGLTRRFDSMAREGFVARRKCYSDRRGVYAELSPLGFERFVAATPTYVDVVRRTFVRPLDQDGQVLLTELLGRLSVEDSTR